MSGRIAGTNVTASATNGIAIANKGAVSGKQHIVMAVSAGFSATPAAPVLLQILDPDISPNVLLWENYVSQPNGWQFPNGIAVTPGHNVVAILLAGGSNVVGKVNLNVVTQ